MRRTLFPAESCLFLDEFCITARNPEPTSLVQPPGLQLVCTAPPLQTLLSTSAASDDVTGFR